MKIDTLSIEYHLRNEDNQQDFSIIKFRRGEKENIYYANKKDHKRLLKITNQLNLSWAYAGYYVISLEYHSK